jgi:23S rRNA (guanosine2251-2'-O)-methyltransferase
MKKRVQKGHRNSGKRNPLRNTKRGAIARRNNKSGYGRGRRGARHAGTRRPMPIAAPRSSGNGEKVYIYGKHALMEALTHAPHAVRRVFLASEMDDSELRALVKKSGIEAGVLKSHDAGQMVGHDASHQGVVAIMNTGALMLPFPEFLAALTEGGTRTPDAGTMLVLLDELTDPHNVGAIIRSAAAFGAAGILIPSHNQAPITGAVVKTSAGMVFRIPLVPINNVNQAIDTLKKEGFKTYGLVMDGDTALAEEPFDAPALMIVGNEGEGIREHTLARCDIRLRIPMDPRAESLNASVSAAVVLYQWSTRHLSNTDLPSQHA